jgi:hypothetical protein
VSRTKGGELIAGRRRRRRRRGRRGRSKRAVIS